MPATISHNSDLQVYIDLLYSCEIITAFSLPVLKINLLNVIVFQELISHEWRVCRLPREVLTGILEEHAATAAAAASASAAAAAAAAADVTDAPVISKAKKRRSASIHS